MFESDHNLLYCMTAKVSRHEKTEDDHSITLVCHTFSEFRLKVGTTTWKTNFLSLLPEEIRRKATQENLWRFVPQQFKVPESVKNLRLSRLLCFTIIIANTSASWLSLL